MEPFAVIFPVAFAFLNRARGTQLFNLIRSTILGRLVATAGMGLVTALAASDDLRSFMILFSWTWAALMLWCTPAWDRYWSAAIGHDPAHSRIWGLAAMTLRMTLAIPCIVGLAFLTGQQGNAAFAAGTLLLGLPYYLAGYLFPKNPIGWAEPAVGAILGFLFFLTIT